MWLKGLVRHRAGYSSGMTTTPQPDDRTDETPGGSTDADPGDNDGSGETDLTGDELDAPDPA
jgi:hypothetical protein